ncbi:TPA: hypothetical protein DD449_03870 [Candidatus Berkelbacteria bacterium]|uniref:Transcriptional regulator n=1 Tax=Berkelbacteria bacterium GW2011_GWE1_39_12 TaxID=1618337 RepID=A0A0G4B2R5_9BACT|nr:MAG: transcriptional regulator [Berkelbacteria bacterium GW2011_GWE1_39_12]HBO60794.1 hypothetical protein [Candidatus Berkelbacteria bacterium]
MNDLNNNQKFIKQLEKFGLKPQEAVIYLACLKLGEATVGQIAKESGIQRTFVYDVVEDLVKMGFFSLVEDISVKKYSGVSIEQFKRIQTEKLREFEEIMPELRALESSGQSPKVQFFKGVEGIKLALEDTLNQESGSEIVAYATAEGLYSEEPEFVIEYLSKRVAKGITARNIAPDAPINREYASHNREHLRKTRLVPADKFPFTNEIDIYGNKVAIMSLQGELLAVIIESESIAKTQRAIFELAWLGAGIVKS